MASPIYTACHSNAFNPNTSELAEYAKLSKISDGALWQQANATEIHCLAQGMATIPGTNTMFFIPVSAIPHGRHATYLCIICAHCPEKAILHHVHWTVGGNHIE